MAMGFFLLIAWAFPNVENEEIRLDDIYLAKFVTSYQVGNRVLVMGYWKIKPSLYLYDFTTGKSWEIEDGRIQAFFPYLAGDANGFRIFSVLGDPRVNFLDGEGRYLRHQNLTDFQGWQPQRFAFLQPLSGTRYLATFGRRGQELSVATIDLESETVQQTFTLPAHESFQLWCISLAEQYYLVTLETGEIRQIDPKRRGRTIRLVRPGIEPVVKTKFRTPYHGVFSRPTYVNGEMYLKYRSIRDKFGEVTLDQKRCSMSFTEAGVVILDTVVLAQYQGFSLIWDEPSGEISLR